MPGAEVLDLGLRVLHVLGIKQKKIATAFGGLLVSSCCDGRQGRGGQRSQAPFPTQSHVICGCGDTWPHPNVILLHNWLTALEFPPPLLEMGARLRILG